MPNTDWPEPERLKMLANTGRLLVQAGLNGIPGKRVPEDYARWMVEGIDATKLTEPDGPVDILLPLGNGSMFDNVELRFALRAIEKYATGFNRIVVVGVDPGFLAQRPDVLFIPMEDEGANHESRIARKLMRAMQTGLLTKHVALWNDDYVLTGDCDVSKLPYYHRGELHEAVKIRSKDRYRNSMEMTTTFLMGCGFDAMHFDIHVPMIYECERYMALRRWWGLSDATYCGLLVKSTYANLYQIKGVQMTDCKLPRMKCAVESLIRGRWVFSYGDPAATTGVLDYLQKRFPKASKFETG